MRSVTAADPKARADIEDNFRKTIGQLLAPLLGGTAVLIGAALAYVQFTQQQQASRDLLISNQVAKGFEQLGSEKVVVRLGGIYALEGVMNNSEQYHQPVLEALSAFVRDGTKTETGDGPPATDIQAVLTVIGRRTAIGTGLPDLGNAHIPNANLTNAHLSGAYLDYADLDGADLTNAHLSVAYLENAHLRGADLDNADLRGAHLSIADLRGAHLRGADLRGADLRGADLRGARLDAVLSGAHLSVADLRGADLRVADLRGAHLDHADLSGADLSGADLDHAYLNGADLRDAKIMQAQLDHAACGTDAKLDPGLTIKPCS
jgi:uncharacterized protein YjbI with pentapeptide repeats